MRLVTGLSPLDAFLATGGGEWIASAAFEARCIELFNRLDRGENMSLETAASSVRLPARVFAEVFIEFAAARLLVEAAGATHH